MLTSSSFTPFDVQKVISEIVDANGEVTLHIVGGTVSVPWSRVNEIRAFVAADLGLSAGEAAAKVKYDRLTPNTDRYTLSATIAHRMQDVAATDPDKTMVDAALVANGADATKFFDPLALSPIAAANGAPILLVTQNSVPGSTSSYLAAESPAEVIIGGGPATVSWPTGAAVGATARWYGPDRYYTATAIANGATGKGWLEAKAAGVAAKIPDAVTGGAAIGNRRQGVLLVTQGEQLTSTASAWLEARSAEVTTCLVFGGPVSVDDDVRRGIARALE
jgi:hypothetical protein